MTRSGSQMETPLSSTHILEILGVAAILYLIGSLRVLRQYERGVVFLLGKFEGVRRPGHLPSHPTDGTRIFANRHDANPLTKNHYEG
jgi:hypothetical protein